MHVETTIADASAIAEEAFVLAYPLVLLRRVRLQSTAVDAPDPDTLRAPVNAFVLGRDTPDTLRVSGWLDLASGPVVLSVPDTFGRYYMLWLRDAWNAVFASIGARTTRTVARAFALTGPGRLAAGAPSGLTPIAAPTRTVRITGCIEAVGESDDCARMQAGFTVDARRDGAPRPAGRAPVEPIERLDARAFFSEVSRLVGDNPPDAACRAALDRLHEVVAWGSLTPELRESLERGVQRGRAAIEAQAERAAGVTVGRWDIDDEPPARDPLRRAAAARRCADPVTDVLRARLARDDEGRPLTGDHRYLLRFAPDASPPVHAFWSLMAGGANSIGDLHGLTLDPDGSLPIHLQHRPPARKRRSNWLPTPRGAFDLVLRLYWPREEALERRWAPPPVIRVGGAAP